MGENYHVVSKTLRLCWFLIHLAFEYALVVDKFVLVQSKQV